MEKVGRVVNGTIKRLYWPRSVGITSIVGAQAIRVSGVLVLLSFGRHRPGGGETTGI